MPVKYLLISNFIQRIIKYVISYHAGIYLSQTMLVNRAHADKTIPQRRFT